MGSLIDQKALIESNGCTVVELLVDGITYLAAGYRIAGEVDLHDSRGKILANATFLDNVEQASLVSVNDSFEPVNSTHFYFEHAGKSEQNMATDVGSCLVALLNA